MSQEVHQEDEILGKAYDARLMARILRYLRPYWKLLAISFIFLMLQTGSQLLGPYITKVAIDRYIAQRDVHGLDLMALAYLGVVCVGFVVLFIQTYTTEYIGQRAMHDLRMEVFSHLQCQDMAYFDRNAVGRLLTRTVNDVETLNELFSTGVVGLLGDVSIVFGIAGMMLWLDWKLALVCIAAFPVILYISRFYRRRAREVYRESRLILGRLNAGLQENIAGVATVQAFGQEEKMYRRFREVNLSYRDVLLRSIRYNALFFPVIEIFSALSIGLLLWYGGQQILSSAVQAGVIVAFIQYVQRMYQPIRDLAEKYNIMQAAMASSERVFRLLDTKPTIVDPPHPRELAHVRGEITFENVSFAYNEGDWVLRDVNFTISAGESVAIVGATGAGKTSIISLISRFYDVQKGRILLDGVDLRELRQMDVRRHVGVVLQDPFIFAGTIASNIRLNNTTIVDQQVRSAATFVNADKFIERLPQGYDTVVTERGSTLSVGQKQLLAFARAIAFNPEILLVLDEATSSVDTETEHLIQDALAKLMVGRTSIIIAHRLSTIQNVDRIIVLHKGRVVEMGTHRDLLAQRGVYHRLYELQYRAHEAESPMKSA